MKVTIDLGLHGKAGVEGWYEQRGPVTYVYLHGSDHWYDWLLHVLPWIALLERRAARQIARQLPDSSLYYIGGHSAGFPVACSLASMIPAKVVGYGGKRPARLAPDCINHRNVRDVVPYLPPWRPQPPTATWEKGHKTMYEAHQPRAYYDLMQEDSFR